MYDQGAIKLIIISLIYCNIYTNDKHLCEASAVTNPNICDFVNRWEIYCNCDNPEPDEARHVTCFIVSNELTETAQVWNGFKLQRNITSLIFTTRLETKLSFLPIRPLKTFADSLESLQFNEMSLGVLEANSISNFTKLSKVNLESNEIRGLNENAFAHLSTLKTLSLSSNLIEIIRSNVFVNLPNLDEIFLDRNQLKTIEDNAFVDLKLLREIDLRLNQIETITSLTFSGMKNLKRIDLSRNKLKVIPDFAFTGTPLLRELDLNQNQINTIEENAFHNMSHLMSLRLNDNQIRYLIPTVFKGSNQLLLIDLTKNSLITIERELFENLEHLRQEAFMIYLSENPLECDCRLLWITNMSRIVGQLFKRELKHIKCKAKAKYAELEMGSVADEEVKVLRLLHNESFLSECQSKTTTKQVITENENLGHSLFPEVVDNINHSLPNVDKFNNKIDEHNNHQYISDKTHLYESTETNLHEVIGDGNSIEKEALKPSDSEVKNKQMNGNKNGINHDKFDTTIFILCSLLIFIFGKN